MRIRKEFNIVIRDIANRQDRQGILYQLLIILIRCTDEKRGAGLKEKTKTFYKTVFKYWMNERKAGLKRLFATGRRKK